MEPAGAPADEQERREGRGRLSSIDLLPEEADGAIAWANEQLRERKLPQTIILVGFNDRLVALGIPPISKSAWSRYAVRKAIQFRRLDDARRMSAELITQLGPDGADELTVMVAELLKTAMLDLLDGGKIDSKGVMELSRGLSSVVNAQKASVEHRQKLEAELDQRLKKAAEAVTEVGAKGGVTEDTLKKITSLLTTGAV
jgi:hypothetical protein